MSYEEYDIQHMMAAEPAVAYEVRQNLGSSAISHVLQIKENIDDLAMIEMLRGGLNKQSLLRLASWLDLTIDEMSDLLHVSARTIQRKKSEEPLGAMISERLLDLARVLVQGMETFDDLGILQEWLRTPIPAFEGRLPWSLLDTSLGCNLVYNALGRLAHGVYS